jgi:hypothetical protein
MSNYSKLSHIIIPQYNEYYPKERTLKALYDLEDYEYSLKFFFEKYQWQFIGSKNDVGYEGWKPFQHIYYHPIKNTFLYRIGSQFPPPDETDGLSNYYIYFGEEEYLLETQKMINEAFSKKTPFTLNKIVSTLNQFTEDKTIFYEQFLSLRALVSLCNPQKFDENMMELFLKSLNHTEYPRIIAYTIHVARLVAWEEMIPIFKPYVNFKPDFEIDSEVLKLIKETAKTFINDFDLHRERALSRLEGEFLAWWDSEDYDEVLDKSSLGLTPFYDNLPLLPL